MKGSNILAQVKERISSIKDEEKLSTDLIYLSQIYLANDNFAAAVLFIERAGELGADPAEIQAGLNTVRILVKMRNLNRDLKITQVEVQPKGKCLGIFLLPGGIVYFESSNGKLKLLINFTSLITDS